MAGEDESGLVGTACSRPSTRYRDGRTTPSGPSAGTAAALARKVATDGRSAIGTRWSATSSPWRGSVNGIRRPVHNSEILLFDPDVVVHRLAQFPVRRPGDLFQRPGLQRQQVLALR